MAKLEDWSIGPAEDSFYLAPELRSYVLQGVVYGHPKKSDGKKIRSSRIVSVLSGRSVQTLYTVYELGEPSADYLDWLKSNGYDYDPENPLKVK